MSRFSAGRKGAASPRRSHLVPNGASSSTNIGTLRESVSMGPLMESSASFTKSPESSHAELRNEAELLTFSGGGFANGFAALSATFPSPDGTPMSDEGGVSSTSTIFSAPLYGEINVVSIPKSPDETMDKSWETPSTSVTHPQGNGFPELDAENLEALLKKLFPTRDYKPARSTVFSLLLNLRVFVSPEEILQKLLQHCMFEQNENMAKGFGKASRQKLFENMYELMEDWAQQIPYDFRHPAMRNRLLELFGLCRGDALPAQQARCDELVLNLRAALSKWERYENALKNLHKNVEDPPITSDHQLGLLNICSSAVLVAQQLTHIELERLSMIGADELVEMLTNSSLETLGQFPTERTHCFNENCLRKQRKFNLLNGLDSSDVTSTTILEHSDECSQTPNPGNIRHYIDWFNQLTTLIASEILRHSRKRHRVRCIEFLIECARECCNVGNFNSLMAIVAGLSAHPIARLKRTWARVEKSKLEVLQHQLDPSGNFLSYRATLKAAIWRSEGAKQDSERLIIPFFGLLLKDLFMVHRHCRHALPNGQLNFSMFNEFAAQISNLSKWKTRNCPFKKHNPVLQYLLLGATYSEKNMLLLSYQYELPETNADREQYKKLSVDNNNSNTSS